MQFTSEYAAGVQLRLLESFNEREPSLPLIRVWCDGSAMRVVWEPGDATRYEAFALCVPDRDEVVVCGDSGLAGPWVFRMQTGGFLHTSYFAEKNPTFKPSEYSFRKAVQICAAIMNMRTDANNPPDYSEED